MAKRKRMRLPNGFGRITEIKGRNLRNPFRVMVTIGKDENGRPIGKLLHPQAYFKTYNEAYAALMEYNKDPYNLDDDITVSELYERWSTEYFKKLKAESSVRTITSAWSYCTPVYDLRVKEIRQRHIRSCMEKASSDNLSNRIKSLWNLMLDYALEYNLVDKNYARTFDCASAETKKEHMVFSEEEMKSLWKNDSNSVVRMMLINCYSGWRPQELLNLKREDVDITEWTFKGGMKTNSGINRIVPIHSLIRELVLQEYNNSEGSDLLFSEGLTYYQYKYRFGKVVSELGLNEEHRPHDCRKQFVTEAKKYNVDEYAIKRIVGHTIKDITEKIYTTRNIQWLHEEINKIQGPNI